jgi:hypothetical protein
LALSPSLSLKPLDYPYLVHKLRKLENQWVTEGVFSKVRLPKELGSMTGIKIKRFIYAIDNAVIRNIEQDSWYWRRCCANNNSNTKASKYILGVFLKEEKCCVLKASSLL